MTNAKRTFKVGDKVSFITRVMGGKRVKVQATIESLKEVMFHGKRCRMANLTLPKGGSAYTRATGKKTVRVLAKNLL